MISASEQKHMQVVTSSVYSWSSNSRGKSPSRFRWSDGYPGPTSKTDSSWYDSNYEGIHNGHNCLSTCSSGDQIEYSHGSVLMFPQILRCIITSGPSSQSLLPLEKSCLRLPLVLESKWPGILTLVLPLWTCWITGRKLRSSESQMDAFQADFHEQCH
jgi:hypothetical protein